MGATGFGKGLAVRHDFRADIQNLYERENLKTQIQVEKQRKAEYYGNMLKQGHVRGPAATKRLEQHYDQLNNQLADFVTENPDWETDPGKFSQFINITDGYLNNDIIREDLQVQKQYEALQAEAQRGTLTSDEIMSQMAKYDNYIENGGDPYVFINPKKFEYEDILKEDIAGIGYYQGVEIKEGEGGIDMQRTVKAPKQFSIQTQVRDTMADKDRRRAIEAQWKEAGGYDVAPTAAKFYEDALRAGTDYAASKWTYDQYQLRMATSGANAAGIASRSLSADLFDNWMESVESGRNVATAPSSATIMMTPFGKVKGTHYVTSASRMKVLDKDGKPLEWGYTANMQATGSGRMVFLEEGGSRMPYVEVDVEFAIPIVEGGKPEDSGIDKFARENDFTSTHVTQYAQFDFNGLGETKKYDAQVYNGKIYAPASFTLENMARVDASILTAEEERSLRDSPLYGNIIAQKNLMRAQVIAPGAEWQVTENGRIISSDGLYEFNPDIEKVKRL